MQAREMTSNAHEMKIGITKKRKVQHDMKQQSLLFGELPDEMVMNILSYGDMDDIENTRAWQSKKVQHFTESICKEKAAEKNNLDNMKWIYEDIGDTEFYFDDEKFTCTGTITDLCSDKEPHSVSRMGCGKRKHFDVELA